MAAMNNHEVNQEMRKWERWRAYHSVRWSWRASFLILASGFALKLHWLLIVVTLIGYQGCEFMDCLARQRALDEIASEEYDWKTDPEDPDNEIDQDGSTRIKLPQEHQIVVGRIIDRLRRMLV